VSLEPQTFGVKFNDGSNDSLTMNYLITGSIGPKVDVTLAAGTVTDQEIQLGFDVTTMKGVLVLVTGNDLASVVLETNSAGSPVHTYTFLAGGGVIFWCNKFPAEVLNPFKVISATDVTTMFVTKSGADTPRIRIFVLN
jgi:hypothetical protein